LSDAPESLQEYWDQNLKDKTALEQVDSLKNFNIATNGIDIAAETTIGHKVAHNNYHKLWIDSTAYSKKQVVMGLMELNCFPLMMPVSGEMDTQDEVKEFWEWMNAFKSQGIDILTQCSWGFDVKEPVYIKDVDKSHTQIKKQGQMMISNNHYKGVLREPVRDQPNEQTVQVHQRGH